MKKKQESMKKNEKKRKAVSWVKLRFPFSFFSVVSVQLLLLLPLCGRGAFSHFLFL